MPATASTERIRTSASKSSSPSASSIRIFQAQRHDDVEQRLDQHAEADEGQDFLVVLQKRTDERIDGGQRAGGFLGREDDKFLIVLVVIQFEFVFIVVILVIRRR